MNIKFTIIYFKKNNGRMSVLEYLEELPAKEKLKILAYIENLSVYEEFQKEPFSRHIDGKLRELKIESGKHKHRVIYFFHIGQTIILLLAFSKKSQRTPVMEIEKAKRYLNEFINNNL